MANEPQNYWQGAEQETAEPQDVPSVLPVPISAPTVVPAPAPAPDGVPESVSVQPPALEPVAPVTSEPLQPATAETLAQPIAADPAQLPPTEILQQNAAQTEPITWTAHEYIHPEKNLLWYILFGLVVLGLIAVDVFILKSWTFSALVVIMAVALIIYIRRPPRELTYALSPAQGLYVGERLYLFDDFKAFGLIRDGEHYSVMLIPRQRFSPGVSVYFPDDAGEGIVDILGQHLPMENLKLDVVDIIVRKLRL